MPQIKTPQELFAGLFTEARPENLPQGASPRSINCDYIVGSVTPRPGKKSIFTYADDFFESPAAFTQSIGTGAPWSAGSVTLNQSAGGTPFLNSNSNLILSSVVGHTEIFTGGWIGGISNPSIMILPLHTIYNATSFPNSFVTGISDNAGGVWSQLIAPMPWCKSDPPPLQANNSFNFQLWIGVYATGVSVAYPGFQLSITTNDGGGVNFVTGQTFSGMWENCTSVDKHAVDILAPTPGQFVNGAAITTTQPEVIISISNLIQLSATFPGFRYANEGTTPGSSQAYLNSGGIIQPIGTYNPTWGYNAPPVSPGPDSVLATLSLVPSSTGSTGPISQILQAMNFNLDIPVNIPNQGKVASGCGDTFTFVTPTTLPVSGIEVMLTGSQTSASPDAELQVQLQLPDGTLSPEIKTVQMPASTGTVTLGSPSDLWGFDPSEINAALLNDPNFTVNIVAVAPGGEQVTFTVSAQVLVAFSVPDPPPNINYLKSFQQTDGDLNALFLGSNGTMYLEDSINTPDVLTPLFTRIFPNSFAQSATFDDREYIAVSDLTKGTDIPRVYSPPNFDRLSQVGPGAAPAATGSSSGGTIPIVSITQPPAMSDPEAPGKLSGILWSAGPGSIQPGTVLTVYYGRSTPPGPLAVPDPNVVVGAGVHLIVDETQPNSQFNGQVVTGDYVITSVGEGIPPGAEFGRWFFTVQMPVSQFVNQADHIEGNGPTGTYQITTATVTTASQVPNVGVGSTIEIAGTGGAPPAGYDGQWVITVALNAAQMQITSTQRTGGIATYAFTLISGTAPAAGEQVTVSGTLNGNGIFNVQNATIQSVTGGSPGGTFSISLPGADIPVAAEIGTAVIFGTQFKFEPGTVVGTRTGGTLVTTGIFTFGQRKVCYSFLTRNGFLTQPSPIFTADIVIGSTGITVSGLLPGPANVIARVVHFTGANGGQFYNIPDPVIVIDPITGQTIVNDSTWVMDNTSTSAVFSFSDETLLAADEIDIQGNNLFACYELGSCIGLVPYAARLAAIGEQNKVFNFRNMSFDGGFGGGPGGTSFPPGWTVDPTNGAGGSLVTSTIFGFSYQIANSSGSTQGTYGMITQGAYKDEFLVDIINASTTYSVRLTAAALAPIASGNLVMDLFSPSLGVLGSFVLPLSSMTTAQQLFTGTILTTMLAPVPKDLVIRLYAQNIPNGATVIVDRTEPFPTEAPNLDGQIILSYANNFEAFDRLTGVLNPGLQNQQSVESAFVQFDTLYMVKTNSLVATNDNGTTEPVVAGGGWILRTISQSVGTTGIYGVTTAIDEPNSGEDWALIAGRAGLFIYDGGEPINISEEIKTIWNRINWAAGQTIWVLNDIINRRILVGVPLATYWLDAKGNQVRGSWLPAGVIPDDPAPTTPNVVLMLNYKQLNSAGQLASSVGVHRSFSGKLLASEITRKWALWTIKAPAAAFLERADGTDPLFLGNSDGNGKIFEFVEGLAEDDGSPFVQRYVTSPFLPRQNAQEAQVGVLRYGFSTMTLMMLGEGTLRITVYPNLLESVYAHPLLPDLVFPIATDGDAEVPLDEEANRLFVEFGAQCVGSEYTLSGMVVLMGTSGYAPFKGVNG